MKTHRCLIAAAILAASAGAANADSRMFNAYLYGGNERPAAGSATAFGIATVVVTTPAQICYSIVVQNGAAPLTVAHIHPGAAGAVGAPVVVLPINATIPARIANCIAVAPAVITAIRANPQNFYVNVHTTAFPGGAARGQLE